MKQPNLIKGLFFIAVPLALLLSNIESPRCEPQSVDRNQAQSLAKSKDIKVERAGDPEVQDEKIDGFKILEWMIRQSLMKQYEKLEFNADLEANLD